MSGCATLGFGRNPGLAAALRQVDCLAANTGGGMFDRLFGVGSAFGTTLTIALTLYIVWLAYGLLSGRSTLKLSTLTPRAISIGIVITLATSWVAYQTLVWDVLTGAPDEIAGVLLGTTGSATQQFAVRVDAMFTAISSAAASGGLPGNGVMTASVATQQGVFTAGNMLWVSALLLLFGSLGVLLVARIALAALLTLGPVFVLFGLFGGTRGLLDGWIKASVMFSITQLLAVLIGGEALALLAPVVRRVAAVNNAAMMQDAILMLLAAGVFAALMGTALKAAMTIVSGWQPTATRADENEQVTQAAMQAAAFYQARQATAVERILQPEPAASDKARIAGTVSAVGGGVIRSAGINSPTSRDRPAVVLPHQSIVAQNRRSGDRLREVTTRRLPTIPAPARTLFR